MHGGVNTKYGRATTKSQSIFYNFYDFKATLQFLMTKLMTGAESLTITSKEKHGALNLKN